MRGGEARLQLQSAPRSYAGLGSLNDQRSFELRDGTKDLVQKTEPVAWTYRSDRGSTEN